MLRKRLQGFPLLAVQISINREKEVSIDCQDDTTQSNERQKNISINCRKSKVTVEPILSLGVKNVENILEMPEYRQIPENSTLDIVESVDDGFAEIIEFDVPDKNMYFKSKKDL